MIPAGANLTPGFFTLPDTENVLRPFLPLRPWLLNQTAPFSKISLTQKTVSTLCINVGLPKSPTWDGNGGLCLGKPLLPSKLSNIDDSSPQM